MSALLLFGLPYCSRESMTSEGIISSEVEDIIDPRHESAPDDATVWYFAFGSNLNPKVFGPESSRRGRKVSPKQVKTGYVPGWRLACNLKAVPIIEPGMGNIAPILPRHDAHAPTTENLAGTLTDEVRVVSNAVTQAQEPIFAHNDRTQQCVHGAAFLITKREFDEIYKSEGGKEGHYRIEPLDMICYSRNVNESSSTAEQSEETLRVYACYCPPHDEKCKMDLDLPSERYITLIREGARHYKLDPAYCDYLDTYPAACPSKLVRYAFLAFYLPLVTPVIVGLGATKLVGLFARTELTWSFMRFIFRYYFTPLNSFLYKVHDLIIQIPLLLSSESSSSSSSLKDHQT